MNTSLKIQMWKQAFLPLLPDKLQSMLQYIPQEYPLEELRIRAGAPVQLCAGNSDRLLYGSQGKLAVTMDDCRLIFERICGHSLYAWEDEIKSGFITLAGGHRVGIGGHIVRDEHGFIQRITDISSLNFRVARAVEGAADALLPLMLHADGTPHATLIISAPGMGKTTILRDVIRQLSYGMQGARPQRVTVVDERMELSGSVRGAAQYDLGPRTDILSGCGKPEGIRLAVRTLGPQVIATDELGSEQEAQSVCEAAFCGVMTIATAHVFDIKTLEKRRVLTELLACGAMTRIVELGRHENNPGFIRQVYNASLEPVRRQEGEILCFGRLP